jgi:hypothetical protein
LTAARDVVVWWIAGALTMIVVLLTWFLFTFRRRAAVAVPALVAPPQPRLLKDGSPSGMDGTAGDPELKERALAELTEFAKQSLVQGLYSQRNALLETQRQAQQELAQLEARLVALQLPDRIQAYEKRIAELEKELATRSGEVKQLIHATLLLMRQKLEQERGLERATDRSN